MRLLFCDDDLLILKRNEKMRAERLNRVNEAQFLTFSKPKNRACANCEKQQEIGYFDWFGKDRQNCWITLGNMSKEEAMTEMIHLGTRLFILFKLGRTRSACTAELQLFLGEKRGYLRVPRNGKTCSSEVGHFHPHFPKERLSKMS